MGYCLLHLVARETAGNENAVKKLIGIQSRMLSKADKSMSVKLIATIGNSDVHSFAEGVCRDVHGERENELITVE
jgi:hypothetical protein